ncbi:unnamed protein product [Schistocephalus solidus]|uniref:Uncharacterized protein n=1 Tax=Schistocephalus solidus TaxID=70667 RepID=A0A183TLB0_SCHSO|nr:unnamed protein product [Schistocephalus solidus]
MCVHPQPACLTPEHFISPTLKMSYFGRNRTPCNRPKRRTVLVDREMARYKVDIAALSETRFSEQGQLEEAGAGYTFFGSGRQKASRHDAGVAFTILNETVGRLFAKIITSYAPPMMNSDVVKDKFYKACTPCWRLNQITQKLENMNAADDNAYVETRWCQLRNVIQSTALKVLERACLQHQDWLDDNDADIRRLDYTKPTWTFGLTPPRKPS